MSIISQFCQAKHFFSEQPSDDKINNCCHKGKVIPVQHRELPIFIPDLIGNPMNICYNYFQNNIRSYNQLFLLNQWEHKYLIVLVRGHIVSVFVVKFITKPATYIRLKVNLDNLHS